MLFVFLFDRALAIPVAALHAPSCGEVIDAGARFRKRPARSRASEIVGDLTPFGRRQPRGLAPFLRPITMTAAEFLQDTTLRGRLPGLREYLRVVSRQQPLPARDFVQIQVDVEELNALLSRGQLINPRRILRKVNPARLVKPGDDEIILVFRERARHLYASTGDLPVWDLRAVVTGARKFEAAQKVLKLRLGFPPANLLKPNAWSPTEEKQAHAIPMVFDLPLNPLEVFVQARTPTTAEVARVDFLDYLQYEGAIHPYEFWLPFAGSVFDVESFNGRSIRGRLVEVLPGSEQLVFLARGEYEIVPTEMIKRILLFQYVPNKPDGRKIAIDNDVDDPADIVAEYLEGPLAPPRQIVITPDGLNLEP